VQKLTGQTKYHQKRSGYN